MEYIYASLILHKLGKPINDEGIKKIIEVAGGKADDAKAKAVAAALSGVDIDQAIKETAIAPVAAPTAAKEEKKEDKKEEPKVDAAAGLGSLFG